MLPASTSPTVFVVNTPALLSRNMMTVTPTGLVVVRKRVWIGTLNGILMAIITSDPTKPIAARMAVVARWAISMMGM
jgi:hypothetical protein